MATKKKVISAAQKRKIVKQAKKNKGLVVVILVILLLVVGFLGFNFIKEKNSYASFETELANFDSEIGISSEISENINLPKEYKGYELIWTSSNEELVKLSGEVSRPNYDDGDKFVTLKATIKYEGKTFIYGFAKDMVGAKDFVFEIKVKVKAKEPTDEDYILAVLNNLVMPEETFDSIGFVSDTCYENVHLSYTSNNVSVIDNNGHVTTPSVDTVVEITVNCYTDKASIERKYLVNVKSEDYKITAISNDFNSDSTTTRYGNLIIDEMKYYNVRVMGEEVSDVGEETNEFPQYLRLRTNNKATDEALKLAYFETPVLVNPLEFSFKYKFDGTQTTEKGKFLIYAKTDGDYTLIDTKTVLIREDYETINVDLSSYNSVSIKVEFTHEWSAESYVIIDDVKVLKGLTESEIEGSVSLVGSFSRSMFLPFSTKYGGSVTWTSSDETKITSKGTLVDGASGVVTLTAHIKVGEIEKNETFEVKIKDLTISDPLEIYFIDLGVYGLSDCGECTYIKYNDIDIIVDGGDHFESTCRAVSDVFEKYTNDKVIDYMIITHPDSDHIGGLPYLFKTYQVNNVYKFADETFTTQKFKNLKAAYDSEPNCNVYDIYKDVFSENKVSDILTISSDIYIKFINTGFLQDKETNGRSIVFELFAYDTKVLMTGDADNGGSHTHLEESYMNQVGDIDILKVCHHGTENGTTLAFLNAVTPEVAVICNGNYLGNKHGHPNKVCLDNLNKFSKDLKIYTITGGGLHAENSANNLNAYRGSCTLEESLVDRNGTINLTINSSGYSFSCALKDTPQDLRQSTYWNILFQ